MYQVTLPEGTTTQQVIDVLSEKKFINRSRKNSAVPYNWKYVVASIPSNLFEPMVNEYIGGISFAMVSPEKDKTLFAAFVSPKVWDNFIKDSGLTTA